MKEVTEQTVRDRIALLENQEARSINETHTLAMLRWGIEQQQRAEAAEAKLAELEKQEPVAWRDPSNSCPAQGCTYDKVKAAGWPHIYRQELFTRAATPAAAPEAAFKAAFNIWQDKTEWVQKDRRFDVLVPWGKHRADVLREYIERLEAQLGALAMQQPFAWTDNEEAEEMQNGTYGSMFNGDHIHEHQKRDGQWFPLYRQAVPPARVLKLPEYASNTGAEYDTEIAHNVGWNACLAEIKRLNEVKS